MSPFDPIPTLESSRLILRAITERDLPDLYAHFANEQVTRWMDGLPPFTSMKEAESLLKEFREGCKAGREMRWGIIHREEAKLIGTIGYHQHHLMHRRIELGYDISPAYWRQGFASEAIKTTLPWAFDVLCVNRIEATVYEPNIASAGLMRKLGFTQEATFREFEIINGGYVNLLVFALLKSDYQGNM